MIKGYWSMEDIYWGETCFRNERVCVANKAWGMVKCKQADSTL